MNNNQTLMVAVEVDGERIVVPCEALSPQTLEVTIYTSIDQGQPVTVTIRDGDTARTWPLSGRVADVRNLFDGGQRLTIEFITPSRPELQALMSVAHQKGLCPDADLTDMGWGERTEAEKQIPNMVRATPQAPCTGLLLRFRDEPTRQRTIDDLLNGAVFVETTEPLPMGEPVVLHLNFDEGHVVALSARVVHISEGDQGPQGMGLALDPLIPAIQGELRRRR